MLTCCESTSISAIMIFYYIVQLDIRLPSGLFRERKRCAATAIIWLLPCVIHTYLLTYILTKLRMRHSFASNEISDDRKKSNIKPNDVMRPAVQSISLRRLGRSNWIPYHVAFIILLMFCVVT